MSAYPNPPPEQHRPSTATGTASSNTLGFSIAFVLLILPAGCVAFVAFVIIAFEIGNRLLALLALVVAGLGVLCGIAALAFAHRWKWTLAQSLLVAAFVLVVSALVGVLNIPTHGE